MRPLVCLVLAGVVACSSTPTPAPIPTTPSPSLSTSADYANECFVFGQIVDIFTKIGKAEGEPSEHRTRLRSLASILGAAYDDPKAAAATKLAADSAKEVADRLDSFDAEGIAEAERGTFRAQADLDC